MSNRQERRAAKERRRRLRSLHEGMVAAAAAGISGIQFGIDHTGGPDQTKYFVLKGERMREISDVEYERLAGVARER